MAVPDNEGTLSNSEPATLEHAAAASNENSPTMAYCRSGCHVDRRMIAELKSSSETDHLAGIDLSSEPKSQLGFIFSED